MSAMLFRAALAFFGLGFLASTRFGSLVPSHHPETRELCEDIARVGLFLGVGALALGLFARWFLGA